MKKIIVISMLGLFFLGSFPVSYTTAAPDSVTDESASHVEKEQTAIMEDDPAMAAIPPAEKIPVPPVQGKQPPEEDPAMAVIPPAEKIIVPLFQGKQPPEEEAAMAVIPDK